MPIESSSTDAAPGWIRPLFLFLFLAAATNAALHKQLTAGFDELAHVSYVAYLQKTGEFWPGLDQLRLLDPKSLRFTPIASYLNHPSPYYWLLARLGPSVEGQPGALLPLRLLNICLVGIGLAALQALGRSARLPRLVEYAFILPILTVPALSAITGSVNNDNLAFTGGALATLAAYRLYETPAAGWLIAALAGMIVASLAKLTGFLLVGGMIAGVLVLIARRDGLRKDWLLLTFGAGLIAAAPYLALWAQYGGPAPETPGHIALLQSTTPADIGWEKAPRLSFPSYVATFATTFIEQWTPSLGERTTLNDVMLAIPVLEILCACVGLLISARRVQDGRGTASDAIIVAGAASIAAALALHLIFSYRRHLAYAYIADAYPRYYFPLIAVAPLAGLSLLAALPDTRLRSAAAGGLIAAPLIVTFLG